MGRLIKVKETKEGDIFCRWLHNRLIRNNKNVLGAELGATGSGKSYRDLRKAELWYQRHFKEEFPAENICFGVIKVMERISSNQLRRGEILIFEEAGVNLGSLDFQNKISKMFTYILQSFRSMNIAIFFNLPYLSMLNKSARMLMHYSSESAGIDFDKKRNKCKLFVHQVNQGTGKIYKKYMRANVNGKVKKIKRINWEHPSQRLADAYESKKAQYLAGITEEYTIELRKLEEDKLIALGRPELTLKQLEIYNFLCKGLNDTQIAKKIGKSISTVREHRLFIKKKGYRVQIDQNTRENGILKGNIQPINPLT